MSVLARSSRARAAGRKKNIHHYHVQVMYDVEPVMKDVVGNRFMHTPTHGVKS